MISILEQREVFHIAFLRLFSAKVRHDAYALKGGVNLRLFCGSGRYSEDMDLDIAGIELFKLKDIVMNILGSKSLITTLQPYQITKVVPPDIKTAKQTDTTQRFKCHLLTSQGADLFTKIEFSRRALQTQVAAGSIDAAVLRRYKLAPFVIPHYPAETALTQKIGALAGRSETEARDIFDIYILSPKVDIKKVVANKDISDDVMKKAHDNVFRIDFNIYRDTVLTYLAKEDQDIYGTKEAWDDIQIRVSELIEGLRRK